MRTLFTFLIISCSTWIYAQKLDNNAITPFQVVFSDSCFNKAGNLLTNFELLSVDDVINVKGQLTLLHEAGLPIEFRTDTTIQLKRLHEIITPPAIQKKKKNKGAEYSISRPKIEKLLLTDGKQALNQNYIACSDCHYEIKIICPCLAGRRVYVSGDLDIKWQSIRQDSFKIEVTTMFGDKVMSFVTAGTEMHMDSATVNQLLSKEGFRTMTIHTVKESMYQGSVSILKYPFPGQIDFNCDTKSAAIALLMGYFLEMEGKPLREIAESYYTLAASLSKNSFFKDMLDNFYKRKSFYK